MDVYAEVTNRIIEELEKGIIPWNRPWTAGTNVAISHNSGKPYSLLNQLLLGGRPGEYVTFKQCYAEGGKVKKGAKAQMVVFWKIIRCEKKDKDGNVVLDEKGQTVYSNLPMLKYFNVFHIDDCEGIKPKYMATEFPGTATPNERAEAIINDYSKRAALTIEHTNQPEAYYNPRRHLVSLPMMEQFKDTAGYYETMFHELTHSTGHKSLLNRFPVDSKEAAFGSECYSKEELVAEIGACFILRKLGIETTDTFQNNVAYIQNWLAALRNDKRLIVSAASRAEKAVKLILNQENERE